MLQCRAAAKVSTGVLKSINEESWLLERLRAGNREESGGNKLHKEVLYGSNKDVSG